MQLYALDEEKQAILAKKGSKNRDYFCPECSATVRLRGGIHRQNHFYHLSPNRHCRLSGKTMAHLQTQLYLVEKLNHCTLEKRFDKINRIADVAWEKEKIVFEVQCSSIRMEEVEQRIRDYRSVGWEIVWILHDHRFHRYRYTAAEYFLRSSPHYFTNINRDGSGVIYDQHSRFEGGIRIKSGPQYLVDVSQIYRSQRKRMEIEKKYLGGYRLKTWPLYFQGDLLDRAILAPLEPVHKPIGKFSLLMILKKYLLRPYQIVFQTLLEGACK